MMDDIDEVPEADKRTLLAALKEMEQNPYKVSWARVGWRRSTRRVGERIKVTSLNYQGHRPGSARFAANCPAAVTNKTP